MVKKDSAKSKVKVEELAINKETVQDLTDAQASKVKGGNASHGEECSRPCTDSRGTFCPVKTDGCPGTKDPVTDQGPSNWC